MEQIIQQNQVPEMPTTPTPEAGTVSVAPKIAQRSFRDPGSRGPRKNSRRPSRREERVRPEFDQKIISLRRVTRVVAGGRRFSFSVALVAGNRKGMVGVGTGKAGDTALAIEKAFRDAKKNMIIVPLVSGNSIPHDSAAKYGSSQVLIIPAKGRGLVAGGAVRMVLEFAGINNVSAKILSRSKNGLNNARAALVALSSLRSKSRHARA